MNCVGPGDRRVTHLGQWEYRVFEKPIIVLIIVDFTSVYRVFFSRAFSVTKTDFRPIIGRFNTIIGIPGGNFVTALGRTRTCAAGAH